MSQLVTLGPRERWSATSMVLKRWLVKEGFHSREPICEIEVDGVARTVLGNAIHPADDPAGIYWFYVAEGQEIGPWGYLLEYTDNSHQGRGDLHASAKLKLVRRNKYPRIFLNYRRDDADAYAGRLHEVLTREFGRDDVFMDEFSILPGEVFTWTIQQAVVHATVVLALIGPRWLTLTDAHNNKRIESERDYVRRELTSALDRGTLVLPVLLPRATWFSQTDHLPDGLESLQDLQYHEIAGPRHWEQDVKALVDAIKEHLERFQ